MDKLQLISIQIMNSKHKLLFNLFCLFIIYFCFYYDRGIIFCMNETNIPEIAEAKPYTTNQLAYSRIRREIDVFAGFAETIEEQKKTIARQQREIQFLEDFEKFLIKDSQISISESVQFAQEKYIRESELKNEISELKSENYALKRENFLLQKKARNLETLERKLSDQTAAFNRIRREVDSFHEHYLKK